MAIKKALLLDTNFLMVPAQLKINIFRELSGYELLTLDSCIAELERIGKGRGRNASFAKISRKLVNERNIKAVRTREKNTDQAIVNYAKNHGCAVATNDKKLIKTLKSYGIKIIRIKQRKYLSEE